MVLIIVHIFICVFLVCVILLQPGKSDAGIGFGSSSQSIFGSKGASNFLTKTTSVCAILFLGTSFWLTRGRLREFTSSVITNDVPANAAPAPKKDGEAKEGAKDGATKDSKPGTPPAKTEVPAVPQQPGAGAHKK